MRAGWNRGGFTLIEIAAVMAIITMVLAMAVGAHYAWKRWTALDAAQLRAESCFALARQHAVGTGHPTFVALGCGGAPVATNSLDVTTFFSEQESQDNYGSATNGLAWCCAAEVTNVLDWTAAYELLGDGSSSTSPYPIVGPVAVFTPAVRWGTMDDGAFSGRILLFLPDGSVCDPRDESGAGLTNVLYGAGAPKGSSQTDAERLAAHRRILVLDPLLGTVQTLPRESR